MKRYELTAAQQNIDELQRFYRGTSISVLCGAVIFEEKLERDILMQALCILIRRNEALRLRFCTEGGKTVQYVSGEYGDGICFKKFCSRDEMRAYCSEQARIPFEMNGSEMCRITAFELPDRSGIMLCASHLIADAWTYSILAKEVYEIYSGLCVGESIDGGVHSFTECIGKYNEYLSSEKYKADCKYWSEKYSCDIEETPVRICRRGSAGAAADRYTLSLSAELSQAADMFCRENCISSAALFESAVLIYLSKINRESRAVTIGVPVLGRSGAKEKSTAGMFISTIPLTEAVCADESVISLCRKTADIHRESFRHIRLPYGDILRMARERTGFSGRLFDVMVSCQNGKTHIPAKTEWFSNGYCEVPLAIHIDDRDSLDSYTVTIEYQTDIFPCRDEIRLLAERLKHIIGQMISDGERAVKDISVLPDEEFEMLVHGFNSTAAAYEKDKCVYEAFSELAAKYPDKVALVFRQKEYTYGQLDSMSDALAHFLHEKEIGANDVVPIISRRSPYIIIAMLAVLKAGGAYMPVSPDYPAQRTEYMIKSVQAKLVLTCGCSCGAVEEIKLEAFDYSYSSQAALNTACPDDMCYVIFTSGSEGKPKGTAVTHRNVMNYCSRNEFNVAGRILKKDITSIVSVTDIVFDIFVTESILPLLNGMVIYLADDEQAVSQKALGRLISESGAQVLQTTPTKMKSFLFDKNDLGYLSSLRTVILGGEELPAGLCAELRKYSGANIYNIYGPAETTVWSSLAPADENDITVGKPVANTRIYILDDKLTPVPVGVMGEICISGDGVGKGYINAPVLTAEKFLPDPFSDGDMMYRTGDMGLIRCDGNIEFLGRRDNQIKLRGLRIELGEIESVMSSFDGIEHAAAVCRNDSRGEKLLAGFYTCRNGTDERALRTYMSERLPSYMIPNIFIRLSRMPMTQSGKINRNELPSPELNTALSHRKYTAPENETQMQLCRVFAKVLGIPEVGTEEDFFELGGDSFSAMEFAAIAEDMGFPFSPRSVYEYRTVKKLCSVISEKKKRKTVHKKISRFPLKRTEGDLRLFKMFVWLTKKIYKFEVSGIENIDLHKKYIFCPNHESDLDCMWVWAALSGHIDINDACALIAAEHLDKEVSRRVFRLSGGIPIDRRGDFSASLKRAVSVLKNEKRFLLIHPEGTRTRDGRLGSFKKGAALISKSSGAAIIPVYIGGAGKIYPVNRKIPRIFDAFGMRKYPLRIAFGTPVEPDSRPAELITEEVRRQICDMKRNG
ncbi:MAG: amino acid adenylation domain-containing protein [Huintestinicola sp.]|uniref:amino acid adenylation domain-containing protein n=1 Tax=Huintestinicola sp. TaxID=2981661 RepID=UPI003F0605E0